MPSVNPVMYLIAASPAAVKMSPGKLAAQCAHAAVEARRLVLDDSNLLRLWYKGNHYTKIVLMADDLAVAERYLNDRGFETVLIIDEGRTEIDALTPTCIGVHLVDKNNPHVAATFGEFALYSEPQRPEPEVAPFNAREQRGLFGTSVAVPIWKGKKLILHF